MLCFYVMPVMLVDLPVMLVFMLALLSGSLCSGVYSDHGTFGYRRTVVSMIANMQQLQGTSFAHFLYQLWLWQFRSSTFFRVPVRFSKPVCCHLERSAWLVPEG
jgi:hypothetical protein